MLRRARLSSDEENRRATEEEKIVENNSIAKGEIQQYRIADTIATGRCLIGTMCRKKSRSPRTRREADCRYKEDGEKEGREKGAARYSSRSICSRV